MRPGCFIHVGRGYSTHWQGDRLGPRDSLDVAANRRNFCPCHELNANFLVIQPVAAHCTD